MQTLSQIQYLLQDSLVQKPGLLSRKYGLPLLEPHTWNVDTHKSNSALTWDQFVSADNQAQELFKNCGFRLGILAESVFESWLKKQNLEYVRGLQIFESKPITRTLGELDFIYKRNNQWQHFELAAKIYCYRPQNRDFIGPNKRDFFHRKLEILQSQQLPLISNPHTKSALVSNGLQNVETSSVHFCGRLFYPPGEWKVPDYVNPEHLRGIYFEKYLPIQNLPSDNALVLLPRYLWFLPKIELDQLIPIEFSTSNFAHLQWADLSNTIQIEKLKIVTDHYKILGQTTMLSLLKFKAEKWQEVERILLLPDCLS